MKTLSSDIHLYTAKLDRSPIVVFVGGELIGAGRIEEITENSVKIGDKRYLRVSCTFKYAS
ncbi:hypothetical protein XI25_06755 [Paenibacillus sp. DMB20]|nr:hypothetical protein XI25_06755 [Paenibacillus sp. DMB20]